MDLAEMFDAVNRASIPANPRAVAGYLDGPRSAWSSTDWNLVTRIPHLVISVLADDRANTMDVEYGNAPAPDACSAARRRQDRGQWTVLYCNKSTMGSLFATGAQAGLTWRPPSLWPTPGAYLWIADPTGVPHLTVPGAPVDPVAVQDRWTAAYDVSSCHGTFPILPPPTPGASPVMVTDIVGQAVAPDGGGYWMVGADGGVFAYGSARFYGSLGGHPLARPIVGMASDPDGRGYRLFGQDGGVFCFGAATFRGGLA